MSTCYFLDLFVQLSSDDVGKCRVRRNNRPCLICENSMDLIEVTQSINLFFIPVCFNTKTMSFLDCSVCGFSSTLESYEYLRICQQEGRPIQKFSGKPVDGEQSLSCKDCKSKLAKHWVYCPTCGAKFDRPLLSSATRTISFADELPDRIDIADESSSDGSSVRLNGGPMCGLDYSLMEIPRFATPTKEEGNDTVVESPSSDKKKL